MGSAVAVEVRELSKVYEGQHGGGGAVAALDAVSLDAAAGGLLAVIGPSGCGKSTLLNILAGLLEPTSGTVTRARAAHLPQRDLLMPWRRTLENVTVGLEAQGMQRDAARAIGRTHLATFGLDGFADHWPHELSGGMRQRAELLRTFLVDGELLLLDEPLGALDALTRQDLQQWLRERCVADGRTTIVVTHDIDEAIALADRVCVLSPRPGRLVATVDIALPAERRAELRLTPEFAAHRAELMHALAGAVSA